jgi:predicted component of type VI protein secretion system
VEGGPSLPLSADTVVLGRKPATGAPGTQDLAVPDTTRTLSKVHARVERAEEGWIITDLESTNGVVVVAVDGTETLLERGASAPLTGRFVLGKVAMSIVEEGASS